MITSSDIRNKIRELVNAAPKKVIQAQNENDRLHNLFLLQLCQEFLREGQLNTERQKEGLCRTSLWVDEFKKPFEKACKTIYDFVKKAQNE
ncbi:hypothetical protein ACFL29_01085 [Patescibacteria group bacterium]